MENPELYLNFSKKTFNKTMEDANKEGISVSGNEGKDDLMYPKIIIIPDGSEGLYFGEDNILNLAGEIFLSDEIGSLKDKLGYFSLQIPFNMDLVIEIIEAYRKKLGKLKTILEATK